MTTPKSHQVLMEWHSVGMQCSLQTLYTPYTGDKGSGLRA